MGIKSSMGKSRVTTPKMTKSAPISITSGKAIVQKPINAHHANPGYKAKGM